MNARTVSALFALVGFLGVGVAQTPALDIFVAYPPDKYEVESDHVLFEGSVQPGSSLSIDGRTVDTGTDGLFIEWLPLKPGANSLQLETKRGETIVKRTFSVTSVISAPLPASPAVIVKDSVSPGAPILEYSALGSTVGVSFAGSPGGKASFTLGTGAAQTMTETSGGSYRASYRVKPGETLDAAAVKVTLTAPDGSSITATSAGTVTVRDARTPRVGRFIGEYDAAVQPGVNVARNRPGGEYVLFPRKDTRLVVIGENGSTYRVRIAATQDVYLRKDKLELLPEGTPLPSNTIDSISTKRVNGATEIYFAGAESVPYSFEQDDSTLTVRFYTTLTDTDSAVFAQPDPTLKDLRLVQESDGVLKAVITLKTRQQWGYVADYTGTTLKLRIKDAPTVTNTARPLEGRSITIDPGHGGEDTGGEGPLRVPEKGMTLPIATRLAELLRAAGARVVMTRTTDVEVDLYERSLIAARENTDVFVSIHLNAIPDNANPANFKGSGAYYYHPQARALADYLLSGMVKAVPEMGSDGVHYQNLAVARTVAQPQVLLELGFLTNKDNLRLLMSGAGQQRIAAGIADGLAGFFLEQTRR